MLAIITVIYKNYDVFHEFVASITAQTVSTYKVYVYDATPENDRVTLVCPPEYRVVQGPNNGYAYGVNRAIEYACADGLSRFAIVNPDVIVANNFVQACEDALIQYPMTIIAGKIYYAPRYEYHSERVPKHSFQLDEHGGCFPLPSDYPYSIWYAGGQIDWAHATTKHIGVDDLDHPMYDESGETDFATGCCMVYDKSVSDRVGLWDEGYFMYYEDADFCVRAKRAHISTRYIPSIRLWHKNAQSTGGSGSDFHVRAMRSARLRFGLKYAPTRTKLHLLKNIIFPRLGS